MKKQDIIDAIDIEIEYIKDNFGANGYRIGFLSGLDKAKEVIERLDRGEIQFAKEK